MSTVDKPVLASELKPALAPVALDTWGGFVFLDLSDEPPPLAAQATRLLGRNWFVSEGVRTDMQFRGFRGGYCGPMGDPSLDIRRD